MSDRPIVPPKWTRPPLLSRPRPGSDRPEACIAEPPSARQRALTPESAADDLVFVAPAVANSQGRALHEEFISVDKAWSWDQIPTRNPVASTTAKRRRDPFDEMLWVPGSTALWLNPRTVERRQGLGGEGWPAALSRDPATAVAELLDRRDRDVRLAGLGAIHAWRTMTAEQLAAVVGEEALTNPFSKKMAPLIALGVVEVGSERGRPTTKASYAQGVLYRAGPASACKPLMARLTEAEVVAVTGGQPWKGAAGHDRHGVLATEVGLRIAEHGNNIGTVLGEHFSTIELLTGRGKAPGAKASKNRAADLTVVRTDGLRIALEVTASTDTRFLSKVERWAKILKRKPLAERPLCVVFVIALPAGARDRKPSSTLRRTVYRTVAAAFADCDPTVTARVGITTWAEWFPGPGLVDYDFFDLSVDRLKGPQGASWERVGFLALDTPHLHLPSDRRDRTQVLRNAALLGGTPRWFRAAHEPPDLLARRWKDRTVPVPPPAKPGVLTARKIGSEIAYEQLRVPPRMRGLRRPTTPIT